MFESEDYATLSPVTFFQIGFDCSYYDGKGKLASPKYLVPSTSMLCAEDHFAAVHMGWNPEGISLLVKVHNPIVECHYPDIFRGDSAELFFDTRDVKTSGYNTRFCHHFFFLPEAVEGHQAGEITRFRTEDMHELCDPKELSVQTSSTPQNYQLNIFIPSHCLQGYDPDQFDRIGFTYRINRRSGRSQHFSVVTEDFQLEQQPSLWSSVKLVR